MRLELDYNGKTITVKESVNMHEFIKEVKKLGLDLKEWNVKSEIIWQSYPVYPIYPTYNPLRDIWTVPFSSTTSVCTATNEISGDSVSIDSPWFQHSTLTDC